MRTPTPASATDLYQLTMAAWYWLERRTERATFELFTRRLPANRGYVLACGIDDAADYLENLHFTPEEVDYLRRHPSFSEMPAGFFDALAALRFTGNVWAVSEGTPIFPNEPFLSITAPIIEAQIVETALLAIVNFPTSVATKASRLVEAARGRGIVEFGARRAHGTDAALVAARAAYVGGCAGTSNVEAGMRFGIPVSGTVAHAWIMSFEDEVEAFRAYRRAFPHNAILLIDTYDTLRAARRVTEAFRPGDVAGVRIDSGDIAELSQGVREILDAAGFVDTKILASGDLNEWSITDLVAAGAPVDSFGVGTDLTTVRDAPSISVVYKLVEIERDGRRDFKMKLSEGKATMPGAKQIWRHVGEDRRAAGDTVTLREEPAPAPNASALLSPLIEAGRRARPPVELAEIRRATRRAVEALPESLRGLTAPAEPYPVRYSDRILGIAEDLRRKIR